MKYKFQKPWRHWKVGDIIENYQYKMLPHEIKSSIGFLLPVVENRNPKGNVVREIPTPVNPFEKAVRTKFKNFSGVDKKDEEILGSNLETI